MLTCPGIPQKGLCEDAAEARNEILIHNETTLFAHNVGNLHGLVEG